MKITPLLLTRNFGHGRNGHSPIAIVDHVMEGRMEGTLQHFSRVDPADPVSSHYGISRAGEIVQYVSESDTAWHAGKKVSPTAALFTVDYPEANPNQITIGIEHEGKASDTLTVDQLYASAWLHADIAKRRGILLNRKYVIGHHEIRADKTCPGRIDVVSILTVAREVLKLL